MKVARVLEKELYERDGLRTLRHWRGGWWQWSGPRWQELEQRAMSTEAYVFTEHAVYLDADGGEKLWTPNRFKIANLLDALTAVAYMPENVPMPAWLDGRDYDGLLVSVANGLLDVGARELHPHTPAFFNATSVPFQYDPDAAPPSRWLAFLQELWPDELDAHAALQEWFGYTVSGRLDLQKILLLVGSTRAGKGVIARILGALVGGENVAGPTLSSLLAQEDLACLEAPGGVPGRVLLPRPRSRRSLQALDRVRLAQPPLGPATQRSTASTRIRALPLEEGRRSRCRPSCAGRLRAGRTCASGRVEAAWQSVETADAIECVLV